MLCVIMLQAVYNVYGGYKTIFIIYVFGSFSLVLFVYLIFKYLIYRITYLCRQPAVFCMSLFTAINTKLMCYHLESCIKYGKLVSKRFLVYISCRHCSLFIQSHVSSHLLNISSLFIKLLAPFLVFTNS